MNVRRIMVAVLVGLSLVAASAPSAEQLSADRIHRHVHYLASDKLEGRDTGSRGYALGAEYVALQFAAMGLKPGGPSGSWFLQVPLRRASHATPHQVMLTVGGKARRLDNVDVGLRPSLTDKQRSIDAELVFVGHGIVAPRHGIDEYAGLDVRGKIVVVLSGAPAGLPIEVAAHLDQTKDRMAAAKGAIGIAELNHGGPSGYNPAPGISRPVLDWVDASGAVGKAGSIQSVLVFSPSLSRRVFDGAPRSLGQVASAADRPIVGFPLPGRLSIMASSSWQEMSSPEVIGVLPGGDPRLAREHVVLMAHLDHLGVKPVARPREDAIYNGALDNAAGVATMIETARTFATSAKTPRRSLLFIANTGEEPGLLGADYFVSHPTVPLSQIVAAVNLDMPLLTYDFTDVIAFGADHSTIGRTVGQAGLEMGVALSPDPMPQQRLFARSDHYRLVQHGIPSVFLVTGYANGGRAAWTRYLTFSYHQPSDDLAQPIRWAAGARFAELNYRIARSLADAEQRPLWYANDYFGDNFAPAQPRAQR